MTLTDFSTLVLELVGAVGAGQSPASEDAALVQARARVIFKALEARGVYYIPNADDIPDEAAHDLATVVAQYIAPNYGGAMDINALRFSEEALNVMALRGKSARPILRIDKALVAFR